MERRKKPTVIFSRSRCLLCTVSQSLRIFSLILFMSFSFSSLAEEASCSSSRSRIIKSRLALSRSMFKRSLLSMYIRAAVQRDRFFNRQKKKLCNQLVAISGNKTILKFIHMVETLKIFYSLKLPPLKISYRNVN